ncbi:MAG: DUF4157 domain-containing protein [Pyrinomonadaceae bacterium]
MSAYLKEIPDAHGNFKFHLSGLYLEDNHKMEGTEQAIVTSVDPKTDGKTLPPAEASIVNKLEGEPLPPEVKSKLEASFGADFSQVRVHTDHNALRMTSAMGAESFTLGNHIFLSPGAAYGSAELKNRLIAHEVTHVVQSRKK